MKKFILTLIFTPMFINAQEVDIKIVEMIQTRIILCTREINYYEDTNFTDDIDRYNYALGQRDAYKDCFLLLTQKPKN